MYWGKAEKYWKSSIGPCGVLNEGTKENEEINSADIFFYDKGDRLKSKESINMKASKTLVL